MSTRIGSVALQLQDRENAIKLTDNLAMLLVCVETDVLVLNLKQNNTEEKNRLLCVFTREPQCNVKTHPVQIIWL